jgi:hypothetical protein
MLVCIPTQERGNEVLIKSIGDESNISKLWVSISKEII